MSDNSLNIVLNGIIVKGYPGETILDLARRCEIDIPTLCNDDRLEPFTSCYVCVVEVEGLRGHQPACSTKLTEGMKIITDNEGIRKSRKMALELMLSNHYADCLGPCKQTCPAGVDVQGYISLIEKGMYSDAVALIKETNPLPAICGRVCVRPCESECRRNFLDEGAPVGIDYLKRYASDHDLESPEKYKPAVKKSTGKKIAVIGAGPGGLSVGHFMQIEGHQVDIYEAAPKSGGWLRYGIPEYRLPNDILDKEVENITDLGVNIYYNKKFGDNLSYKEIKAKYDALVLTIGSQKGTGVGCEGDDAGNVYSGIDFLKNMEVTGQRYNFKGRTIAVVGGGNTAMDCCRTSIRCAADKVYVIYRRTEKEMPANPIEIHESKLEGVEYMFLTLPKRINKNANGEVDSITCIKMELGEPDASGRRRPVPIENSDFDLKVDYVLAAIGQKTDVNFIDDINMYADGGKLQINKWGDLDADKNTLQTGIPSVFAAGDGVTGPATIIEAIAQARIASNSAHQYIMGLPIAPLKKPFTSKRDNFKKQVAQDYLDKFATQLREEMPTLPAEGRMNFSEVELGYSGAEVAHHETQRCLECGCTAFFNCDLQKHSSDYNAQQKYFEGEFREYRIDIRHPYIEIDNNKCILCARCVRICREVVGANALGLINRGFDTYVAPSMGDALQDTPCESCGMCISTCPTGAITENVIFKPGPVKTRTVDSICTYCSVGCAINLHTVKGFIFGVSGRKGLVNADGNICRYAKFGYNYLNDTSRITTPLLKANGKFEKISFEKAFGLIKEKISGVNPGDNAFFGGARLTNEEMYLIHKLARLAVKTNNVGSFHYLGRGESYRKNCENNVPFGEIKNASLICYIGTEINRDHAVAGFMAQNAHHMKKTPQLLITVKESNSLSHKVNQELKIKSYYHFVKAVNHYILSKGLENALFLRDRVEGFEEYKKQLLVLNFNELLKEAGLSYEELEVFAELYNREMNAVILFSEKEISGATSKELFNLALITGKLGKTASGLISIREKNNSQGLFDMGLSPHYGVGGQELADTGYITRLKDKWKANELASQETECLHGRIQDGKLKNLFIFGEDPVGCAIDKAYVDSLFKPTEFLVVQDYFMTETAAKADLILPASLPAESGGSYTNSQKVIQQFQAAIKPKVELTNMQQLGEILVTFGHKVSSDPVDTFMEVVTLFPEKKGEEKLQLRVTEKDNHHRRYNYGCDAVTKKFEEEFEGKLNPDYKSIL
ncbi:MAG: molybdopterin-dependent oxidoreductase [Bacteroidetes bacterium]|nr:molybdopterin-dependent oxidoreductase [Bacteroidota bacterium]